MAKEEEKKTTTKKKSNTKSTPKKSTVKKGTSTSKKTTTAKKTTTTKKSTTSKKATSIKKSTSTKKSSNTKANTPAKKTTSKNATKKPKKETIKKEEKVEYISSNTITDLFGTHKKEEQKVKPEDVVFIEDKNIKESNLSVEEELDKVLNESNIIDIPVEKEKIIEEQIEVIEEPAIEKTFDREEKPKKIVKKRRLKNWVYIALISIFLLIIIFSIFKIVTHKPLNDLLNERYVHALDGGYREYEIDFKGLKKLNKDTVGYVKLNATKINHIVVKGKDNKYYKNNNFIKKKSKTGWIYMDSRNKLDGTDKNIVIYGNSNKEMFDSLDKVLSNKWQKNKDYHYITYVSENFENRYQVFSTYETDKADIKIDFNKQIDYANYIKDITKKSNYDYKVKVDSYDNILTLVSLDGDKQIVLHAKLIR